MGRKPALRNRADKKEEIKKLPETFVAKGCNISATCKALNISRQTFYDWVKGDDKIRQAVEDAKESIIDYAETALIAKVQDGDLNAIQFFLRAKGKERGYGEQKRLDIGGLDNPLLVKKVYITKEEQDEVREHIKNVIENG